MLPLPKNYKPFKRIIYLILVSTFLVWLKRPIKLSVLGIVEKKVTYSNGKQQRDIPKAAAILSPWEEWGWRRITKRIDYLTHPGLQNVKPTSCGKLWLELGWKVLEFCTWGTISEIKRHIKKCTWKAGPRI